MTQLLPHSALTSSPMIPAGYDIFWSVFAAASFILAIVAIVSIFRAPFSGPERLALTLASLLLPLVGPVASIYLARRRTGDAHTSANRNS